jgi:hypothetical protein
MNASLDPVVRFGPFELHPRTGELRKAGVRINLPDQPLQVLTTLLDRPGELVTAESNGETSPTPIAKPAWRLTRALAFGIAAFTRVAAAALP